jgi:hypothetical protein
VSRAKESSLSRRGRWTTLEGQVLGLGGLLDGLDRGCGGGENDGLDAGVEAALVAAGGVLVQHTLLHAAIQDRDGRTVDGGNGLLVAGGEGLAHEAEGAAELGLVGAVDGRLGEGLTGALEGRDVICHSARALFFSVGLYSIGNRDAGGCWC